MYSSQLLKGCLSFSALNDQVQDQGVEGANTTMQL